MRRFQPEELFTQVIPETLLAKIIQFPLTRFFIKMTMVFGGMFLFANLFASLKVFNGDPEGAGISIMMVLGATLGYWIYCRLVERRSLKELHLKAAIPETFFGLLMGAALFTLVVFCMYFSGVLTFHGINDTSNLGNFIGPLIIAGFIEEYVVRGIIFKLSEEGLGTWIALTIQALFFGFMHAANPNASLLSSLAISLEAGVLLGAIYLLTRRLWMAIGLHFAWNWMQGPFYGVPVSGHDINGFLETSTHGNELLSGGAFGAETSIFAMIACTLTGIIVLLYAIKDRSNIVKPMWKRKKNEAIGGYDTIDLTEKE